MDKLFEETKVKMVMKLRGVSRTEAERIVNFRDASADSQQSQAEERSVGPNGLPISGRRRRIASKARRKRGAFGRQAI